jgi:hypothetical protein
MQCNVEEVAVAVAATVIVITDFVAGFDDVGDAAEYGRGRKAWENVSPIRSNDITLDVNRSILLVVDVVGIVVHERPGIEIFILH